MKTTHVIVVFIAAALCLAQPLIAQSVAEIKSQAEAGDADSQGLLSLLIQLDDIDLPDAKAVELAKESAKAGSPFGCYALGRIYEVGYGGVSKDGGEAAAQFASAMPAIRAKAESGDAWAELLMYACLSQGRGTEKDAAAAIPWLRKAAEQGNAQAQYRLGAANIKGESVEKDLKEAIKWFRKAAEQGNAEAQYNLAVAYITGEGVEKDLKEAIKWLRKAAEQGNDEAQRVLGGAFYTGDGVEKDPKEAMKWFRKAAEQGDAEAQRILGVSYNTGDGVEKDPKEAMKWFRKAAEQGNAQAQCALATFIMSRGKEADEPGQRQARQEGIVWLRKAAEQGLFVAQAVLAEQLSNEALAQTKEQAWSQAMLSVDEADKWLAAAASNPKPDATLGDVVANLKPRLAQLRSRAQRQSTSPSAADIGAMINDANQKLNSNANVEDPEPGKFDGPDTQTVIQIVNLGFASAGDPSMVMTIKRGKPLVATEGGAIPAGTKIFPIRIKTGLIDYDYAFYQDPFGEWQAQQRSY